MNRLTLDVLANTPVGAVAVVCRGARVVAVEIGARTVQEAVFRAARRLGDPEFDLAENAGGRQLREYFAGRRRRFSVGYDLSGLTAFQVRVLKACEKLPFGKTVTYSQLAAAAGSPKTARAVGQALGQNPIPVVIPCHRVVGAGSPGGFSAAGGVGTKRALLAFEAGGR